MFRQKKKNHITVKCYGFILSASKCFYSLCGVTENHGLYFSLDYNDKNLIIFRHKPIYGSIPSRIQMHERKSRFLGIFFWCFSHGRKPHLVHVFQMCMHRCEQRQLYQSNIGGDEDDDWGGDAWLNSFEIHVCFRALFGRMLSRATGLIVILIHFEFGQAVSVEFGWNRPDHHGHHWIRATTTCTHRTNE